MNREITLEEILTIWWAFFWRASLVGLVLGAILGALGGFVVGAAGYPEAASSIGGLMGLFASIPASIWGLRAALKKKYVGFRIVASHPSEVGEPNN